MSRTATAAARTTGANNTTSTSPSPRSKTAFIATYLDSFGGAGGGPWDGSGGISQTVPGGGSERPPIAAGWVTYVRKLLDIGGT